jgi:hypothetical protein
MDEAIKQKLKEWARRYLPAELVSLIITMVVAKLAFEATRSNLTTALVSTWIGSGVYYAYILLMDMRFARQQRRAHGHSYDLATFGQNIRALLVEFGVAELFDLFAIRPALMYYLPLWVGNLAVGTLAGKIAADLTFYVLAIIGYELSKRSLRDFR